LAGVVLGKLISPSAAGAGRGVSAAPALTDNVAAECAHACSVCEETLRTAVALQIASTRDTALTVWYLFRAGDTVGVAGGSSVDLPRTTLYHTGIGVSGVDHNETWITGATFSGR
jgi:hypothetical protein